MSLVADLSWIGGFAIKWYRLKWLLRVGARWARRKSTDKAVRILIDRTSEPLDYLADNINRAPHFIKNSLARTVPTLVYTRESFHRSFEKGVSSNLFSQATRRRFAKCDRRLSFLISTGREYRVIYGYPMIGRIPDDPEVIEMPKTTSIPVYVWVFSIYFVSAITGLSIMGYKIFCSTSSLLESLVVPPLAMFIAAALGLLSFVRIVTNMDYWRAVVDVE